MSNEFTCIWIKYPPLYEFMEKTTIEIRFKSKKDFRNRIAQLWQSQKEDEIYEFIFPDKETEEEFNKLNEAFK